MSERMFLAVDLSIPVVERILDLFEPWKTSLEERGVRVKWLPPEEIHLTLKFLGDVPEELHGLLRVQLREVVEPLFPFQLKCVGVQALPTPERARLLYATLDEEGREVASLLQRMIDKELSKLGFVSDPRPFHASALLGRVLNGADLSDLAKEMETVPFGSSTIKDIALMESSLRPQGATQRVINRFPLGVDTQ